MVAADSPENKEKSFGEEKNIGNLNIAATPENVSENFLVAKTNEKKRRSFFFSLIPHTQTSIH